MKNKNLHGGDGEISPDLRRRKKEDLPVTMKITRHPPPPEIYVLWRFVDGRVVISVQAAPARSPEDVCPARFAI
ncbi:unnamed protein product [Cochlearia groenlandica]